MIYQDPLTQQQPEGEAKLLHHIETERSSGLETWNVKFLSDGYTCRRRIKSEDDDA